MRRSRASALPALVLASGLAPTAALAQTSPAPALKGAGAPELSVYDVYVTSERDVVDTVTTVREISEEDMRQESARTVDEALSREPSIIVRTGGDGEPRLDVRGLRSRQVLLLLDGIPYNSSEDGQFNPALIPTQILDQIDVTYSASSVLYGDGPIAGVLQLHTRSGEPGMQSDSRGEARERGQYLGATSVAGAAGGFDGFLAGQYLSAKGYDLPDEFSPTGVENGGLRENAERDQGNLFGRIGWASENVRVGLLGDWRHAEFEVPPATQDDPSDRFAQTPRFERVADLDAWSAQLSGQARLAEGIELRSWGFANRQREDRRRYDVPGLGSLRN